ncbi:MAG: ankyrin repeat domain-containing protein [bacterium]
MSDKKNTQFKDIADIIRKNDEAALKRIFDGEIDVNHAKGEHGETLLIVAVWAKNVKAVEALLKRGADVNAQDQYGRTPLIEASGRGYGEEIAKLLLEAGADVKSKDRWGRTALGQSDNRAVKELLLLNSFKLPTEKSSDVRTPENSRDQGK